MAYLSLLFILSSLSLSAAADTNSFIYASCTHTNYTLGSSYDYILSSLLSSLANAAAFSSYANFTSPAISTVSQCNADLRLSKCQSCVRYALSQLSLLCPAATGAAIQLSGCFLRYGNDSFIGHPDTTLLYKKCSPSSNNMNRNNSISAMAAMQAARPEGGTYRSAAAGDVQAMSQCVGDLDVKECADCVSNAVAQVLNICGGAGSGEVYLGKCYVRYWSDGSLDNSNSGSGDGGRKTYAILIGLIAGIALIIVFLAYVRKATRGSKY